MRLSVRPITEPDVPLLVNYWMSADEAYLRSMGADIRLLPSEEQWTAMLLTQIHTPLEEKQSYGLIWLANGQPVGHSNVNKIIFGQEAYMHLHLWKSPLRRSGMGNAFVRMGVPIFFRDLQLQTLYCEPYAHNPAPNKTLAKAGFSFLRSYTGIPGSINFEQEVNVWEIKREVEGLRADSVEHL
jgi:RimJ/RimL family protein N-acetyltransferase